MTNPFAELEGIMARLRAPDGCPWDREQTLDTLKSFLVEEAYEVIEAIDGGTPQEHCKELGDLLFQVVFQSQIRSEEGHFALKDVAEALNEKLIRRHPHVFTQASTTDRAQIRDNWSAIKKQERRDEGGDPSALAGVPTALPSLLRADRLGRKAATTGFDWSHPAGVLEKCREELKELEEALQAGELDAVRAEFGDLLFSMANLGRHLDVEPEVALQNANSKFERRFRTMESMASADGRPLEDLAAPEMEELWQRVKRTETKR